MKTVTPQQLNEGIALLSNGKVVIFDNDGLSLEEWLNDISFTVDDDCTPFGYFFDYAQLVDFDPEEIFSYLDLESPNSARAAQFQKHTNLTTTEFVQFVKHRVNSFIESGDYPLVVI